MKNLPSSENGIYPCTKALEETVSTAWQFAASFQQLPLNSETEPIRPLHADNWERPLASVKSL